MLALPIHTPQNDSLPFYTPIRAKVVPIRVKAAVPSRFLTRLSFFLISIVLLAIGGDTVAQESNASPAASLLREAGKSTGLLSVGSLLETVAATGPFVSNVTDTLSTSGAREYQIPNYQPGPILQRFLDGPMQDVEEIVFAVRVPGRDHWYVTFGNYASFLPEPSDRAFKEQDGVLWGYGEGARLCRMNLRTGQITVLLEDESGGIRDPQLSYDGTKVLFAYRRGGEHPFHLYEINIDGTELRQLTDGTDDDIEPTYLPDGGIMFCSSRCRRFVNCWHTRVATLYRCDADGSNIRILSSNNDHDNTPWVLHDGRILYMRWEYVDRSQVHYHHLWTTNPDGTNQTVYYGNMHPGIAMLDAKPIPDSDKIVASFSPGHGRPEHFGHVTVVTPKSGPDDLGSAHNISRQSNWKDPYAITEECFIVAKNNGLFVMDGQGASEPFYLLSNTDINDLNLAVHEPRPILTRPAETIIADRTDLTQSTGAVVLADIYHGRNMDAIPRGTIKKLLILKQVPKPVNFSGGMQPLTIGGSFTMAQILGEAPVEEDGSAHIELPALQSVFFVALDENDMAVKRMHSFIILQPGETLSCVGCHEQRTETPFDTGGLPAAALRPASLPVIPEGIPAIIDFPRDVQPILDRHCVECHSADRFEGKVDLTGDKTSMYTMSYWAMQSHGLVSDGRNRPESNYGPYRIGSGASGIFSYCDGSHYDVEISEQERTMFRLWIDTSATYPGTYASLGCGDFPAYIPWGHAELVNRCGECHRHDSHDSKGNPIKVWRFGRGSSTNRGTTYNISNPEDSFILRAPLAEEAGGLGLCSRIEFESKDDVLYQMLLAPIQSAHDRMMREKRFDMPGFRPNEHYVREMQRFGFLPVDLTPEDPIDVYDVEKAYFDSFNFLPETE